MVLSCDTTVMSDRDRRELERYAIFLYLIAQAENAGVDAYEAATVMYHDVYGEADREEAESQ